MELIAARGEDRDFDLHGLVGIRLVDADVRDVAVVRRQLGLPPTTLRREPDIVIRFVDRLRRGPLTYVGLHDTGFDDDGFVLLRGNGGAPVCARVPFEEIGQQPEIVCQRGAQAIPHLLAVLNLTALTKEVLALHASAFTLEGVGVLVTGWSKGGKTEALLAAAARGAHYVGDEWVYLTEDGTMRGLPERIRLWAWHLDQLPEVLARRPRREKGRLRAWRSLATAAEAASSAPTPGASLARKAAPVLARQAYVQVPPAGIVGEAKVDLTGRLDAAVLVLSGETDRISRGRADARHVAARMAASLEEERGPLLAHYRQYRFAFPGRRCRLLDDAARLEADLLTRILGNLPIATVTHPYPCDIADLGDAVIEAATAMTAVDPALERAER